MKLTKFEKLLREVQALGGDQVVASLIKTLELGHEDVVPEDIVFGEHGLFYINDQGILTRVIVHIVDIRIDTHYFPRDAKVAVERGDYEDPSVIQKAHKYHILNCTTLQQAQKQGWREKYKMSQKRDGTFYYRFLSKDKVYKENLSQTLLVCGYCLNELNKKHQSTKKYTKTNFSPEVFFSNEFRTNWLNDSSYAKAEISVPNVYQQDWEEISRKYKSKVNYQCEEPGCRYPDLSKQGMRQYLHSHHVNMIKNDNNYSNLRALCLACHAEQPGHEHMKNQGYIRYVNLIDDLLKKRA